MSADFRTISAQQIYEHVDKITSFGPREDGTVADLKAVDYIADGLRALGLDVKLQDVPCWVIEPITTSLSISKPQQLDVKCHHANLSGLTGPAGVNGELVLIEKGFEEDFKGRDLTGKIAVVWQERYWESGDRPVKKLHRAAAAGALAMIIAHKRRDDLITCWSATVDSEPANIPMVSISYPDFVRIRGMMDAGPVEVTLKVMGELRRGTSPNVVAVIPGTELPDEMVGIGACHHETVPMCPGANDDASGQALLLELARFFTSNPQKRSILLLSNGGEEGGLFGTVAFVKDNKAWLDKSLKAMVMVDQMGGAFPVIFGGATIWLEKLLNEHATRLGYRIIHSFDPLFVPGPDMIGDNMSFVDAGYDAAVVAGWPSDSYYHTAADTLDKVNVNGVKAVADTVASVVMELASK